MTRISEALEPQHLVLKVGESSWVLPILLSVGLVVPCLWRPIVSSVDLQSHLYNAWLADLIRTGSIHGLWIGHQSTNVLVDTLLAWLLNVLGVSGTERVITSALVLVFFWGGFRFISRVRGQAAYWLTPWLAILSYGFVFQDGMLNYYLSCGIVLWLFASVWGQRLGLRLLWAAPLLVVAYVAHPMPVLWFVGLATYCWRAQLVPQRSQIVLFLSGIAVLLLINGYIVTRYPTTWRPTQLFYWTGLDQVLLYGWFYVPVTLGFLWFSVVVLRKPENGWRAIVSVPAQAYFLNAAAILIFPMAVHSSADGAWAGLITARLSLLSGVLLLAVLARSTHREPWHLVAGVLAGAMFFGALYRDIGREARVEAKMETLIATLPAGERVVSYTDLLDGERGNLSIKEKLRRLPVRLSYMRLAPTQNTHLLSRACLGHCFDYMNYEPSSGQFRIHALPGNLIVIGNWEDVRDIQDGTYVVKASDSPLYALFRCGPGPGDVALRLLPKGEPVATLACSGKTAVR